MVPIHAINKGIAIIIKAKIKIPKSGISELTTAIFNSVSHKVPEKLIYIVPILANATMGFIPGCVSVCTPTMKISFMPCKGIIKKAMTMELIISPNMAKKKLYTYLKT